MPRRDCAVTFVSHSVVLKAKPHPFHTPTCNGRRVHAPDALRSSLCSVMHGLNVCVTHVSPRRALPQFLALVFDLNNRNHNLADTCFRCCTLRQRSLQFSCVRIVSAREAAPPVKPEQKLVALMPWGKNLQPCTIFFGVRPLFAHRPSDFSFSCRARSLLSCRFSPERESRLLSRPSASSYHPCSTPACIGAAPSTSGEARPRRRHTVRFPAVGGEPAAPPSFVGLEKERSCLYEGGGKVENGGDAMHRPRWFVSVSVVRVLLLCWRSVLRLLKLCHVCT